MSGMENAPELAEKKNAPQDGDEGARIDAYVGRDALRQCGGVYVISRRDGMVKVGITAEDFSRRFKEVGQDSRSSGIVGLRPEILVPMDENMAAVESKVHKQLSAKREGGEWFRMSAKDAVDAVLLAAMRQRRRNAEGRKMVGLEDASQLTAEERLAWAENPTYENVIAAALSIARSIGYAEYRAEVLRGIAWAQVKAGNSSSARNTLTAALAAAQSIDDAEGRVGAMGGIAWAQAEAGDLDGVFATVRVALSAAQGIDDAEGRAEVLCNIAWAQAEAQAQAGDLDGAFATVQTIDDAGERVRALVGIASARAQAGDSSSARGAFAAALSIAQNMDDESYRAGALSRARALSYIARAQARAGDLDGAFATARTIDAHDGWAEAWSAIASTQAEAGDVDGALSTVRTIDGGYEHSWALHAIAKAQAEAGDVDGALSTARRIYFAQGRAKSLSFCWIAKAQAEAGDKQSARAAFAEALSAAQNISDYDAKERAEVLCDIATAQAQVEAGDEQSVRAAFADALSIVQNIDDAEERAGDLRDIAEAQAKTGDKQSARAAFADALSAARNIAPHLFSRAEAFFRISSAQAKAGDFREAVKTALGIDGGKKRANALAARKYRAQALAAIAGHLAAREKE